ncbi:protein translocase subunit SecD [Candidatus Liberibacter asiaticus]|uniref:Multifunctional fusion protein n=4 Tax=Liberibacter asiaticus TaxID=34021 RepID=C6XG95_LIBAP|nr:protein translocase subunit SecD [Candidatus Liberibacter asiaticus]ACT57398.1 bifunctional preprotein translocase subunit SecD/SecF [Candidatus Liberibacter asiaticus str. psy62]AGH17161.1 bifunctional preprotein translocase subunit SecD/SecF [Candidatus Liberibacter asiaticus str. gxpsy]ALK07467.1 protein translocase subunit SecD [Candidatus Liberibacter asiaticus]ASK52957.1 protein translocase subunit SecDF [Candidatus Liberibacter asiaticus]AWL14282.1 protein translocase subunit SecD [C
MRNNPWLVILYSMICCIGLLIALPNFLPQSMLDRFPSAMPKNRISLGLDLRGGSHLVLEVDEDDFVNGFLQMYSDELRSFLKKEGIGVFSMRQIQNKITLSFADSRFKENIADKVTLFLQGVNSKLNVDPKKNLLVTTTEKEISIVLSQNNIDQVISHAIEQSMEIIRQRIDQIGISESTIQRLGSHRILIQLPGEQDPSRLRQLLGTTAKMSFHKVLPNNSKKGFMFGVRFLRDSDGNQYLVEDKVEISGIHLNGATANFDPKTHKPVVDISFDEMGARRFFEVTRDNIGKPLAVVLDGRVLTAPVINQAIPSGKAQISGNFTIETAGILAAMLRAGSLPIKLNIVEERNVGADLGSDSIYKGTCAIVAGLVLIVLFMIVLYGKWGLVADFSIFLNVILTLALLSLLGATLTLPSIAGIVLGIGLAVDSNILVNERIREENRKNQSVFCSLDMGFSRAYSTIFDSNITALIATVVLFFFGGGAVRGFAITMGLSILISMFTAISIVRAMMIFIIRYKKMKSIDINPLSRFFLIPDCIAIQFMRARFWGVGISILFSICSICLLFTHGLNYGIDFKGGIQLGVLANRPVDLSVVRSNLESLQIGDISFQNFDGEKNFLVRLQYQPGDSVAQTRVLEMVKKKITEIVPLSTIQNTEIVGPKISRELIRKGIVGVIISAIAMLIYIWIRFKWYFALGAITTLILDITKTLGFFALFGIEFNLTAVAAVLTLIGYSVNDKVVVYDRMRKNMKLYTTSISFRDLIDKSINETLGRSVYTSMAAFISVLPMAVWGGSVIGSFAIPMAFGIVVAASSSIFIAAPILLFIYDWRAKNARI